MPDSPRTVAVREMFRAYADDDRASAGSLIAEDFRFFSPPDPGLDRDGYFERCWPNGGRVIGFELTRLVEAGDEVIVTYEAERNDGSRFRNTEVMTFVGDAIACVEVYFGWELDEGDR